MKIQILLSMSSVQSTQPADLEHAYNKVCFCPSLMALLSRLLSQFSVTERPLDADQGKPEQKQSFELEF